MKTIIPHNFESIQAKLSRTKKMLVKTIALECQQCLASGDEGILRLAQTKKLSSKPVTENQFS